MFDFSIANILKSNLINFIIMIGLFASIFIVISIKSKGKKSEIDTIKEKIENSENSKNDSYAVLEQVKEKLENSKFEVEKILEHAKQNASELLKKAESEAQKSVIDIEKNTEKIISTELNQIQNEIKKEIASRSIKNARENIIKKLNENPELHQKYIYEAIEKISEANL